MNRDGVWHVVRASASVLGVRRVFVIGSQAIWGSLDVGDLPEATIRSMEVDVMSIDIARYPDGTSASDRIDGAIGWGTAFHDTYGYYADGVDLSTATFPDGWQGRLLTHEVPATGDGFVETFFPEIHDLCHAKLAAGRTKDHQFVDALLRASLVDLDVLHQRANRCSSYQPGEDTKVRQWLARQVNDQV